MVLTDLLLQGAPPTAGRFFNALAEEPETVAAALVPQIRATQVMRRAATARRAHARAVCMRMVLCAAACVTRRCGRRRSRLPRVLLLLLQGARNIEYLTPLSAVGRVVSGLPQILKGGRFFDKEGKRVPQAADAYNDAGVRLLYDFDSDRY
jgi:hypothetical protein